ncbi:DUF819 family protein, partial [Stenotrophomonas maltophilia]|uniref:DUF819 family protein n=1 Tax=Stenotrophomonas maltophilia TaxID=40324 RepID=UPI002E7619E2
KLLKVPFFYFAIGSQSNIGGPASAPVVAAAFHPALPMRYATGNPRSINHAFASSASCSNRAE